MPRSINNRHRCPWDFCGQCSGEYPITMMTKQRGMWVCRECLDSTDVERHPYEVARVLSQQSPVPEGGDQRFTELVFFGTVEEII